MPNPLDPHRTEQGAEDGTWRGDLPRVGGVLAQARLRELLGEVQERIEDIVGTTRTRMSGLVDAVLAVSAGLEIDATLRRIVQAAIDLVDARYGALGVLGENGVLDEFVHVGIDDAVRDLIGPLPTGGGVLGVVIEDAKPLRLAEISAHPVSVGFPPNHSLMHTFLGVPIRTRGQVFGRLYLAEKHNGEEFTDDEIVVLPADPGAPAAENTMLRIAVSAGLDSDALTGIEIPISGSTAGSALALERAESQAARRELDVLADRDRIARDLHDQVIQRLFAIGLSMQGTHRLTRSPAAAARLTEHIDQLHEVIQDIRSAIFDLRAESPDAPKLRGTLHEIVNEIADDSSVRTTIRMSGPLDGHPPGSPNTFRPWSARRSATRSGTPPRPS